VKTQLVTWIERGLLAAVLCLDVLFLWPLVPEPAYAEIRLDTGDLRYVSGDQIVDYREMQEAYRSALISASRGSSVLTNRWVFCTYNPHNPERNIDKRCQRFYREAAAWLIADREIGLVVTEDVARSVESRQNSGPDWGALLMWVSENSEGTLFVRDGWQKDERVQEYLSQHDIRP
jgi:hypothetical protein